MTTLGSVITGAMPLGLYALWSNLRRAQHPEEPGGLLAIPPGENIPFSPTLTNNDPRPGDPGQMVETGPARLSSHRQL